MKVRELAASLARGVRRDSTPKTDSGAEENTDSDPDIVWLMGGPAQDAIVWPTRVFPGISPMPLELSHV